MAPAPLRKGVHLQQAFDGVCVQGQPILWFWGLSGHRYLALLLHEAAVEQRLRVLCIDRPG